MQKLARSDALTGLPNRRALDDQLPREMSRALRAESPLCLAIIDIDHFKLYNDTHGHLAGDAVLRDCAAAWDAELRGEDTILRFGGEEFLVVLPDCGPVDAAEIVERLRAATPDEQTCSAGLASGGRGRASTISSAAPTKPSTRPRRRARPPRQRERRLSGLTPFATTREVRSGSPLRPTLG